MDMEDKVQLEPDTYISKTETTDLLKDYPTTNAIYVVRELISYIHSHWKSVKCPPDTRKVVKRTSQILKCVLPEDYYQQERSRKFINVENSGPYSVPWKPYSEIGKVELDIFDLVLNNLVQSFQLEKDPLGNVTEDIKKPGKKTYKEFAHIPKFIYPFPENQFGELTAYDVIKESLDFITEISEDLKNPRRNLQETYMRKKKEFGNRHDVKEKGMIFIPFKPVDHTAAQDIVEAEVEKFSMTLRAILDITSMLLNLEDKDIQNKIPLSRLAMVRLKRFKDVGIPKTPDQATIYNVGILKNFTEKEIKRAKETFGRPESIWQNKYEVTGVRHSGSKIIRYEPNDMVNQLRGVLIRSTEKVRSGGIYILKRLETEFDRRYKYTSLALSTLPLILIQQSEIPHYAEYLKSIVDKAAYAKGNPAILKSDKDLALYLLEDLDEILRHMLEITSDGKSSCQQEIPKPLWYQMLEHEADERGILGQPRIQNLLNQIYQIHNFNLPKVKYIHEKFCLLISSAAMDDVCNKPWQTAAKFIHEHIIDSPEGMIEYWLAERGVPIHIKPQSQL